MLGIRWCCLGLLVILLMVAASSLEAKKGVKQVVIKEETRVEGKIQKPEVWYLLPRSNLSFEVLELKKKLVPKIEEYTKKAPF